MLTDTLNLMSPFVRFVKITKSHSLAGEWQDYDNVFTYIEQGEAIFVLNGVSYRMGEGDAILMTPFMPHIIRSTSDQPLIQYIMHFDCRYDRERSEWDIVGKGGEKQRHVPDHERMFASFPPVAHIREADRIDLKRRFLALYKEYMDKQHVHSLMLKSIALELIVIFLRNQTNQPAREMKITKGWSILESCINYIQKNYHNSALDNGKIGDVVGVSPSHLSHLFKEQLGITVHKYLTHVRMEHAKKRMLDNKFTLTQIAEQVGFSSIHHFSRAFKNMVGMTGSKYMALHSNMGNSDLDK